MQPTLYYSCQLQQLLLYYCQLLYNYSSRLKSQNFLFWLKTKNPQKKSLILLKIFPYLLIFPSTNLNLVTYLALYTPPYTYSLLRKKNFMLYGFISLATHATSILSCILGKSILKSKRAYIYTKQYQSPCSKTHGDIILSKPLVQAHGTSSHF